MNTQIKTIFFITIVTLFGCEKQEFPSQDFKIQMLNAVNELRQEGCTCGTTPMPPVSKLTWNNKLTTAAENHALDMNDNDFFSHTGSDGGRVENRVNLVGYSFSAVGENIAQGNASVEAVVEGWRMSVEHCLNMMEENFEELGAAKVGAYWVQTFGKR